MATSRATPQPPDRRALPKDAGQWVRDYVGGLENLRREHLVARQGVHLADLRRLRNTREAVAKRKNAPREVLALIDDAIVSARHDAAAVEATLDAIKAAPQFEPGGYVAAGVLATSTGKGPADGSAALVIQVTGGPTVKPASGKVGQDGSVYLVLPAKTAKQFAGQSAAIEITVAGKPLAVDAKVTIRPGQFDMVSLPLLPEEGARPRPSEPTPAGSDAKATRSSDEPEETRPRPSRRGAKRGRPKS
jgi:hypothetical protein